MNYINTYAKYAQPGRRVSTIEGRAFLYALYILYAQNALPDRRVSTIRGRVFSSHPLYALPARGVPTR